MHVYLKVILLLRTPLAFLVLGQGKIAISFPVTWTQILEVISSENALLLGSKKVSGYFLKIIVIVTILFRVKHCSARR